MEIEPEKVGMADAPAKQYLVRRSKKLPAWLWIPIAHALGIRIRPNDRAVVATVLYTSTIVSALGKTKINKYKVTIMVSSLMNCPAMCRGFVVLKVLVISTSTYVIAEVVQHSRVSESMKNNQTGILMTGDKVAGSRQTYHTDVMDGTQ